MAFSSEQGRNKRDDDKEENSTGGINNKDETSPAAAIENDEQAEKTAAVASSASSRVTKRKIYIVEYVSKSNAYIVQEKKLKTNEHKRRGPYNRNQIFCRREFVVERNKKLAESDDDLSIYRKPITNNWNGSFSQGTMRSSMSWILMYQLMMKVGMVMGMKVMKAMMQMRMKATRIRGLMLRTTLPSTEFLLFWFFL